MAIATTLFLSSSWYRVAKLRPKLRDHASIQRHRYRGSAWYVVHDHATGRVHRLSTAGCVVVGAMNGNRTVHQVWEEAGRRLGEEAPSQDELIKLLAQLSAADLLHTEVTADAVELLGRAGRIKRAQFLQSALNPLALRLRLWRPDRFLDRTAWLARWLISRWGLALWCVVVLPAIALATQHWEDLAASVPERGLAVDNLLPLTATYLMLKALHELGHGYAVKVFGGPVHEFGVMFLVFAPVPYVDASAASEFRNKWSRALVGAAGMIVEVFLAALALYVWLIVEDGVVRSLAYNVMLIAGIATVVFNGNPLLRYDGYYILSDVLEIPNLWQRSTRYWGYLLERYVFRSDSTNPFFAAPGEPVWLLLYAPTSFLYRVAVMLAIALFIASEYLAVGIAVALLGLFTGIAMPMAKALGQIVVGSQFRRIRTRALWMLIGFGLAIGALLFLVPAPSFTTSEGIVWLPDTAIVRTGTSGFVQRLLVSPGTTVEAGQALMESEEPTLDAEIATLRAKVDELSAQLAAERFANRAKAEITATEVRHAREELATQVDRERRLTVRSPGDGVFAILKPQDLPGRFLREGDEVGYVLPPGLRIARVAIRQDDIDLVRNRLSRVRVKLAARSDETFQARVLREVPAGRDELPSRALGSAGGGALPVDPRDPQGNRTYNRIFQIDLELAPEATMGAPFGSRVYVRFDLEWEPVGQQLWRRARQLLLARLSA